ncbi:hypothetical protein Thal_1411 [Thermocrinis albus DSM 14484]|uniref:Uncharacterized protein n=1 Tax=Thermocrinis albus (strain DSM 14484 / JCM 11386 / HI 11/12) TaxID=638303 RepID=D3SMR0_THEAH|nr:hypothetical protein [Thermocrinis albus]ADC90040.1 hypothetical protein Thal_1411 [Thermocrinis albus DSM 14484]
MTYVFLRRSEDELVENYFREPANIRHLVTLLNGMDALAYLAEILHEYVNMKEDLKRNIYSENGVRKASVREGAQKLDFLLQELLGTLEIGRLKDLALANHRAYLRAKREKPKVGPLKLFNELRGNEKLQLAIGFVLLLLQEIADTLGEA